MAKLQSGELSFEIKFNLFEEEWVDYKIRFYWKDDIIINDSILKREGKWWGKRPYGTFLTNDYKKDYLMSTIRKVLETDKPEYWEPVDPDVKIAIYPSMYFPFLASQWIEIDENDEAVKQIENGIHKKRYNDKYEKREDDIFTIIIFIDSYNLKESRAYSGEGISLHLVVERHNLEKFTTELETEYNDLINKKTIERM